MFLFQVTHWCLYREEDLWNPQTAATTVPGEKTSPIEKNHYRAIHVKLLSSNSPEVELNILRFT